MERAEIPCPSNSDGCKYSPNCHTSTHHTYPRRLGRTALDKAFIEHPVNKVRVCRMIHDFLDLSTPDELPSEERMLRLVNGGL
jgi:hypothetical protein